MKKALLETLEKLPSRIFDAVAWSVLDFEKQDFQFVEWQEGQWSKQSHYYDLASLTKPLTMGLQYLLTPEIFTPPLILLLEHRSSLPAWARLSKGDWKEHILAYEIKESGTNYSDLGFLRLMLEIEESQGRPFWEPVMQFYDSEVCWVHDLPAQASVLTTGIRQGHEIRGAVHDDNAFLIARRCAHAGLFGTIEGLSRTMLQLSSSLSLLQKMQSLIDENEGHRFIKGWDHVEKPSTSLAGKNASPSTFGHLGFTGTSVWIDCEKKKGHIILTNASRYSWYERSSLNKLRKRLGEFSFAIE